MELTQLIERVKKQDRAAFEELYNRYYQMGFSLALQFVRNEDDALDIMQDVFVTIYSKLESLENAEKFKSWYMQIVANKCRDHLKKKNPLSFTDANAYDEDGSLQYEIEETDREFIPEESMDYSETVRIVDSMIAELPEEQRLCILLYFANDMTIPEIAKTLQVSEATVKSRIKYAKDKIRAKTEDYEKKTGTKLYGLAGLMLIPFIRWALSQNIAQAPQGAFPKIAEAVSHSSSINATASTIKATAESGVKIARRISSMTTMQKVVGGVVAGVVLLGSTAAVGTVVHLNNNSSDVISQQSTKTPLDLEHYLQIEYSGSNGHASASLAVDFEKIDGLLGNDKVQEFMSHIGAAEEASAASLLEFSLSSEEDLSNGDEITVTVLPSECLKTAEKNILDIEEFFNIAIDQTIVLTVDGLAKYEELDILSMVKDHIIYEGGNGDAYAYWNFPQGYRQAVSDRIDLEFFDSQMEVFVDKKSVGTVELTLMSPNPQTEIADDLEFIYYESGPLSNGDLLTIELGDYQLDDILKGLNPLGFTLELLNYTLTVTGL